MKEISMLNWAKDLYPVNRSITGAGVRETLRYIKKIIPDLKIQSVPSGYKAFDWIVPKEWSVKAAYIEDDKGKKIVDFKNNNLHLVGYSVRYNGFVSHSELMEHLYFLDDQPEAIPYVTSYYKERWGFCIAKNQLNLFQSQKYKVVIDTDHFEGVLNYGEIIIPGKSDKEVFISTYICHPSMANNELSGPVVVTELLRRLTARKNKYSYRVVFVPETIGSLVYLSLNLDIMKSNIIAGYNVSCVGDERQYSFLPSRNGNTLADRAAKLSLDSIDPTYKKYTWFDRGSDERQYCAPLIDLPVASVMRTKYGEYPEYHTSLDNFDVVTEKGLQGGFNALWTAIKIIEKNTIPQTKIMGEPQLGKRGLYPDLSIKGQYDDIRLMTNFISLCDGTKDLIELAEELSCNFQDLLKVVDILETEEIIQLESVR